ncbi:TonB-dependent receptor [Cellulophaga sp. F20128]|nr:TonB-dependent receptor [Cellulophaga sp. F20128]MCK0156687.1 TonB-dependent receptor [Cellulophaga sp. F20128]
MRTKIITVLFVHFLVFGFAQENKDLISLSFENAKRIDVIHTLEEKTNYTFYFVEEWLDQNVISGSFRNAALSDVLGFIFEKTNLNYFILNSKSIILTQNRVVYSELPPNFFGKKEISVDEEKHSPVVNKPIFYSKNSSSREIETETSIIGKENVLDKRKMFTVSGYVTDSKSENTISDVLIFVQNAGSGTVSNGLGYYEISIPKGENELVISSMGFKEIQKKIIAYNDGVLNIAMTENIEELDEVILDGNQNSNVEEAEMGANEISSEETKNIPMVMGERNILKVATTLPGITTAGEGSGGFNVRGGKTDQNLILLDDAVLYNPAHFFGIFQALNPFTTKSIKIYKGSVPAQFGGRLSSVFDITTKDANLKEFQGEASIGPVTNNVALEIPLKENKTAVMLGGRSSYSDWILKSLNEKSLENSKASFFDLVAKFNTKIDNTSEIRGTAYYSKDDFSITSDSMYTYSNRLFSVNWLKKINEKNIGSFSIFNSHYKYNIDYEGVGNSNFAFYYDINEIGLKLNIDYLSSKQHKINYGVSSKKYIVSPGNIDPLGESSDIASLHIAKEQGMESAIYLTDNYEINDKWLVSMGLRYSMFQALGSASPRVYQNNMPKNEETIIDTLSFGKNKIVKNYGGLETRLSGRYLLNKKVSLKMGYNSMYQYVHTLTNNTTMSPIDIWKLSDYNVKPQQSEQIALGIFKNIEGNTYEVSIEGYYKKSKNIPDFKTGAQLLLNENVETEILQGEGKSYGVELLVRKNQGKLNGWIGYTYSRSFLKLDSDFEEEEVNKGDYFPSNYDKPHNLSIVSNLKLTRRFSLSANFEYQTGRPITYPIGNFEYQGSTYTVYSDRNKYRIPDYYRLDLSFNVEGNHKLKKPGHGYWNFSIYNVLGRNNPYAVFFVTKDGDVKAYKSSIFSIPIPTISYNIKF